MAENVTLPPELTDLIIHQCATMDRDAKPDIFEPKSSFSKPFPSLPYSDTIYTPNTTLLTCSLVCKNWVPSSRNLAFSHVAIRCISKELEVFLDLYNSPHCTFRGRIQGIRLDFPVVIDSSSSDLVREGAVTGSALKRTLKLCSSTLQSLLIDAGIPFLGHLQFRRVIQGEIGTIFDSEIHLPHLTDLTIASFHFESSSSLTKIIHSRTLSQLKYLTLYRIRFDEYHASPHLPPQKLEKLIMDGDKTGEMIFKWLMAFPTLTTSPIKVLKLKGVQRRMGLLRLAQYLMIHKDLGIELVEIEFGRWSSEKVNEALMQMLRRSLETIGDGNGDSRVKPPCIVAINFQGRRTVLSSSSDSRVPELDERKIISKD